MMLAGFISFFLAILGMSPKIANMLS